jgi:hypothetical protein
MKRLFIFASAFLFPNAERASSRQSKRRGNAMLDVFMLAMGLGAFALFLGYAALSERL